MTEGSRKNINDHLFRIKRASFSKFYINICIYTYIYAYIEIHTCNSFVSKLFVLSFLQLDDGDIFIRRIHIPLFLF